MRFKWFRLSFIGHSLGGIIIRAALPHMLEFHNKMYTIMTLSTPHLGYMYNSSSLIGAGKTFFLNNSHSHFTYQRDVDTTKMEEKRLPSTAFNDRRKGNRRHLLI